MRQGGNVGKSIPVCTVCEQAAAQKFKAFALLRRAWKAYKQKGEHIISHEEVEGIQLPLPGT